MNKILVGIIEPSDREWRRGLSITQGIVANHLQEMNLWLAKECGVKYEWEMLPPLKSKWDALTLCTEHTGIVRPGPAYDEGQIWWRCFPEMGVDPAVKPHRLMAFVAGDEGEHWAGGRWNPDDTGTAMVGEDAFRPGKQYFVRHEMTHLFGISSHPYHWKDGLWVPNLIQEGGLLEYVPYYLQPTEVGTSLSIGQKMQLLNKNFRFLKDAA